MIKGIILDVDGVIIGEKVGFNSPYPNDKVAKTLFEIRKSGVNISLCTAKPYFSVSQIIQNSGLDNYHICEGGAVLINPISHQVLEKQIIPTEQALKVVKEYLTKDVYVEIYTIEDYFIQSNFNLDITNGHSFVLQKNPVKVDSLLEIIPSLGITKIMPIARDEEDKKNVQSIFNETNSNLVMSWGVHPVVLPLMFGIVTAPGISKQYGATKIIENFGCAPSDVLGIGDSTSDWQFMEMCGYVGAMGNATPELKKLVVDKGKNGFVGGSVDENGVLDILTYFKLVH